MSLPIIENLGLSRQLQQIRQLQQGRQVQLPAELQPFAPGASGAGPQGLDGLSVTPNREIGALDGNNLRIGPGSRPDVAGAGGTPFDSFAKALERELEAVNGDMHAADDQIEAFVSGEEHSVHEVMVAMNKADTSFRMLTTITRRVVDAYQEVLRMQV